MSRLQPPPLPADWVRPDAEALPARASVTSGNDGFSRVGLVMMFLLCCGLPIVGATFYVWHRGMTAGGGGLLAGGFFYMLACLFTYLLALLSGILNCWHCVGGFVVACAFACRGPVSRTSFWVMGGGYGLLSGLLLLDAANGNIGPAVQPLAFPIPVTVATWVVPALGILAAAVTWRILARPAPDLAGQQDAAFQIE